MLCLKNICRKSLLGSYFKMSNATVCCEILVLSFLKKAMLSQFILVNWDSEKFPVIPSSFLLLSQFAWIQSVLGHFRAFKKQEHMLKSTVFHNIHVYCHWCLYFFLFRFHAVSPLHKAAFAPLCREGAFHI